MRNVNVVAEYGFEILVACFILTMRNVNFNEVKVHRYILKVLY